MRIMSFGVMWDKLQQIKFTTFRFPRKDKDWQVGEVVQVWLKTRSPEREYIGEAVIEAKEHMPIYAITDKEAILDGFTGAQDMFQWLRKTHSLKRMEAEGHKINKLTLRYKRMVFK